MRLAQLARPRAAQVAGTSQAATSQMEAARHTPAARDAVRRRGVSRRALLAGAAALIPGATACGALGAGGPSAPSKTQQPVTLHYSTFWDQARLDVIAPVIKQFEHRTGHTVVM